MEDAVELEHFFIRYAVYFLVIAAIAVLFGAYHCSWRRDDGPPVRGTRKFTRLADEGAPPLDSRWIDHLFGPMRYIGACIDRASEHWQVSSPRESPSYRHSGSPSYRSLADGESRITISSGGAMRSPIKTRIRNLNLDLAEEASIKAVGAQSARSPATSSRSPPRSFGSAAPRRFKTLGTVDCSLAFAALSCLCIFCLAMVALVNLVPLPPFVWEAFWKSVDPALANVRQRLPFLNAWWTTA